MGLVCPACGKGWIAGHACPELITAAPAGAVPQIPYIPPENTVSGGSHSAPTHIARPVDDWRFSRRPWRPGE